MVKCEGEEEEEEEEGKKVFGFESFELEFEFRVGKIEVGKHRATWKREQI